MSTSQTPQSQREPLRTLSLSSTRSRRRGGGTHYRQATLSECLEAYISSQTSSAPSSDGPVPPSSSVRASKRPRLENDDFFAQKEATSPPTSPASRPSKPILRSRAFPSRCIATRIEALSLYGGRRAIGKPDGRSYEVRGYLESLLSHDEHDVAYLENEDRSGRFAPYALALSNAAKRGERAGALAVATHAGDIFFFDPLAPVSEFKNELRPRIEAHANAIFTLSFSPSDELLISGGGDFACGVFSPSTGACIGILGGHQGTVRSVGFSPADERIVVTGSRDGSVALWDLRAIGVRDSDSGTVANNPRRTVPTLLIRNVHDDLYAHRRGPRPAGAVKPSIAGASILAHNTNHLITSASGDGVVKLWDLRTAGAMGKAVHPKCKERSGLVGELDGGQEEDEAGGSKGRGVSRMVVSPTGDRVYTLGMDSVIRTYDPQCLRRPTSLLPTYSSASLNASSFYVPLALSPCERFISCGSTDGNVYIWDTQTRPSRQSSTPSATKPVVLNGHLGEVAGMDWSTHGIVSAGDDLSVRRWRFDRLTSDKINRAEMSAIGWSGAHSV